MTPEEVRAGLFALQDEKYQAFQRKLLPTLDPETVIGVRTPEIRALAGELVKSGDAQDTYTVRFGLKMLMQHFLGEDFSPAYPEMVSFVPSGDYYIDRMAAWYFATALAKNYEEVLPYLEEKRLAPWVHQKTIQKAVESYRIRPEQQEYLRSLRLPKNSSRERK